MQGKHGPLSREQKQLALRLRADGWRLVDTAREIGCSAPMVGIMARAGRHPELKPCGWKRRPGQLTIDEREQILLGLSRGSTFTALAQQLGRGGGRASYSAWHHTNVLASRRDSQAIQARDEVTFTTGSLTASGPAERPECCAAPPTGAGACPRLSDTIREVRRAR